jgi:hypothetical protein
MVLLTDFYDHVNRLQTIRKVIPDDLVDRVFVLGCLSEPEALRQAGLGSYEAFGKAMADDCRSGTLADWDHDLLRIPKANSPDCVMLSVACCSALKSLDERRAERDVRRRSGFVVYDDLDAVNAALRPHQ